MIGADRAMHRLDEGALAHAARAPQQGVVGGQPLGEAARVGEQQVPLALDALEQGKGQPVDTAHGQEALALRLPDEGLGRVEIRLARARWGKALEHIGKPVEAREQRLV